MLITSVEAIPLRAELSQPFRFGNIVRTRSQNVLVKITTDTGATGWGEACPVPQLTAETQASVTALVNGEVRQAFVGQDARARHALLAAVNRVHLGIHFTMAALDTALLDVVAQGHGMAVSDLLGGRVREQVEVHGSVGWDEDPQAVARTAQAYAEEFTWLKLYAGKGTLDADLRSIEAAREAVGAEHPFLLDINGLWTVTDVVRAGPRLREAGVQLIEQPVHPADPLGNATATRILLGEHGIDVAADESIRDPADVAAVARAGAASVINVGMSKMGGITPALAAAQVAAAHGLPVMVGGVVELGVANAAGLQLAAVLPALAAPSYLMGPLKYAEQVTSPVIAPQESRLRVPTGPGLGVTVDEDALGRLRLDAH
ncbi:mandelate racemase/muconate lactonizing enzyme family protein [Ornithinimicrobium cavernae]|uniref:mandelate racemase/muconate lactonizing enzyme family protein n=1 Tax=Ornithinimicrobium cavernae TaxID=2666047 RepID=UPI000D69C3DE|nr:mandelate racemase/muconate lactonizing enzyme family protein [Ornithinimicrobium cavernae]